MTLFTYNLIKRYTGTKLNSDLCSWSELYIWCDHYVIKLHLQAGGHIHSCSFGELRCKKSSIKVQDSIQWLGLQTPCTSNVPATLRSCLFSTWEVITISSSCTVFTWDIVYSWNQREYAEDMHRYKPCRIYRRLEFTSHLLSSDEKLLFQSLSLWSHWMDSRSHNPS